MSGDKPEFIYLDNAATTRMLPEAVSAMLPFFTETYGNASAVYEAGQLCRGAVMQSRKTIADLIGADRDEIYFTSGGSEADNWALKGAVELALDKAGYIIADESTRTSIPGVFAVGDVRTKALRQVVTAVSDGAVAVHYAEEYLAENR